jgi:hypothetical protein
MIRSGKKRRRPVRLSPLDYIASLVRSDAYVTDYENFLFAYEKERDEKRRGIFRQEEGNATWDFLNRWPLILEPIPPVYARKSPEKYLDRLLPAVFSEMDIPRGWFKSAYKLPWPEGRFMPVWINFFRSEKEITKGIKALLKQYHISQFKKSVPKARGMPDPWKVWDTFKEAGESDVRKTAEILFPKSFRYKSDKREMKAEAWKEYEEMKKTHSRNEADAWYDNRLAKAKSAKSRQVKRKKLIAYVREVIDSCRRKIEMHSPTGDLKTVSVCLSIPGNNLPS